MSRMEEEYMLSRACQGRIRGKKKIKDRRLYPNLFHFLSKGVTS